MLCTAISVVVAFSFFFLQSAHLSGSLVQTIDSVTAHVAQNLDEKSLPLTFDGISSVAGRI